MNRREFLRLRPTKPSPASPAYPIVREAGSPRQYAPGSLVWVQSARAWLGCDEIGFFAIAADCPEGGCMVQYTGGGYICVCRKRRCDAVGYPLDAADEASLRYVEVNLDSGGNLIIHLDRTVSPQDRFIA